jgi:hypothetical protein
VGLAELEGALARLYTDDALRERFFADPAREAATLGLSGDEAARLAASDRGRIDLFADTLRVKRFGEVSRLLPRTLAAAGEERFRQLFFEFATTFVPEGVHKHTADALAFASRLTARLDGAARGAAALDRAALGLFYRPAGNGASARRGPAVAVVRADGAWVLLLRAFGSARFRAFRLG